MLRFSKGRCIILRQHEHLPFWAVSYTHLVLGDWEHPYKTMDPGFEAEEVKVFGSMYRKGYIYKGLKPVYWCPHDETALAEAEIEYQDDPCTCLLYTSRCV